MDYLKSKKAKPRCVCVCVCCFLLQVLKFGTCEFNLREVCLPKREKRHNEKLNINLTYSYLLIYFSVDITINSMFVSSFAYNNLAVKVCESYCGSPSAKDFLLLSYRTEQIYIYIYIYIHIHTHTSIIYIDIFIYIYRLSCCHARTFR